MAREHCFYEDIFNYLVHGTFWAGATDIEKDKLHKESLSYSVIQGDLFYTNPSSRKLQQVVSKASDKKHAILESHIKDDTSDHLNIKSTCLNLRKKYHWKEMECDVSDFIKTCQKCSSVGNGDMFKARRQVEFLDRAWKLVEFEITGPLLMQEKQTFVLRITDIFSKWISYSVINEINFKNMSDILLKEFCLMGFPAGVRVVGVRNSEKFVDTFENTLKDFIDNVNKINLLLSSDSELIDLEDPPIVDSYYKEDSTGLHYSIPLKNEENAQNSSDGDTVNILTNKKFDCISEKNANASSCESYIKNTENGCEVNNDLTMGNIIQNCAEPKEVTFDGPGTDDCKNSIPMGAENLTTDFDKDCENIVKHGNKSILISILPQVKNYENDTQIENEAVEAELTENGSSIESIKENNTINTLSSAEDCGVQMKDESETTDEARLKGTEHNVESKNDTNILVPEEKNEVCAETSNKNKASTVESEDENFNQKSNKTSDLQSFLPSKDVTQSSQCKKDDKISGINLSHQNENHTANAQDSCCRDSLSNIPVVKVIKESENTFKDLGGFEAFLKSGVSADGTGPLLYFFLAQESLLDSETQNLCRIHLQKFIKQFPDSWIDKMPCFNFHIKNTLSTSFQTPSQLLLHRDPNLLRLHENPDQSFHNLYFQKEIVRTNQSSRSSVSPEGKQVQLSLHKGCREHSLSTSTSVRRDSKYGLRKSPKQKNLLGFSDHNISPKKRQAAEDTTQDFTPPLKTSRLSKQLSPVKQRVIAKMLKNYSLKNPVIALTPLPHSLVEDALQGKVDVIFLKKYIQLNCKNAD